MVEDFVVGSSTTGASALERRVVVRHRILVNRGLIRRPRYLLEALTMQPDHQRFGSVLWSACTWPCESTAHPAASSQIFPSLVERLYLAISDSSSSKGDHVNSSQNVRSATPYSVTKVRFEPCLPLIAPTRLAFRHVSGQRPPLSPRNDVYDECLSL